MLYPVMLDISGKHILVIGGGSVALRKIQDLLDCGAQVTVIAPDLHDSIIELESTRPGAIQVMKREYIHGDLDGHMMVFSATNNESVNRSVYQEASGKNIMINSVDDPENCSFFVPSWFSREQLIIAVSTSGVSPSLAARFRREIEKIVPDSIESTLAALKQARSILRYDEEFKCFSSDRRGSILKQIVNDDKLLFGLVESYKNDSLKNFITQLSSGHTPDSTSQ